uniref:SoHo domain-containing protein n=1 Tax=Taeniopygia guttata TaxID=59729 RepID=A0A674G7U9_TAEGU
MGGPAPERGALGGQRTPGVPGHTGTQRRAGRSLPPLPGDISGGLSPPRCAETFPAPSPGQVPAVGFSSLRSQLRPARPGAAPQNPGASRGPRWHRPGGHGVKPRHTGSPRAPSPVPPGMAGRLLPPEPSPATAVGDVPPLHPPLQVSPQRTVTRVPVIRHRGSNTLNFHFHDPENSQGAPESSVNEWYQTWPAKEAKAPSTPMPTHPSPSPRAAPACPPGCSATWTKDSKRRERRWVKYDGIGPVDETGMPLASRSSVDSPRDWYRSMFRQIHRKLPGEAGHAGVARSGHGSAPAHLPHLRARLGHPFLPRHGASVAPQAAEEGLGPSGAPRDAQRDGLDPLGCRRCHRRAWQHFRLRTREFVPAGAEPGGSAARAGSVHRGAAGAGAGAAQPRAGQGHEGHGDAPGPPPEPGGCSHRSLPCSGLPGCSVSSAPPTPRPQTPKSPNPPVPTPGEGQERVLGVAGGLSPQRPAGWESPDIPHGIPADPPSVAAVAPRSPHSPARVGAAPGGLPGGWDRSGAGPVLSPSLEQGQRVPAFGSVPREVTALGFPAVSPQLSPRVPERPAMGWAPRERGGGAGVSPPTPPCCGIERKTNKQQTNKQTNKRLPF